MEIERKFLVNKIPSGLLFKNNTIEIEQYYIDFKPEIRIRKIIMGNDIFTVTGKAKHYMTIKSEGDIVRNEMEFQIYPTVFNKLKSQYPDNKIRKTRYFTSDQSCIHTIEIDIYKDMPLIVAEVEFEDIQQAKNYDPPNWFVKEVTNDPMYKNKNLARYGLPK